MEDFTELCNTTIANETTTAITGLLQYNNSDITAESTATSSRIKTALFIIGSIGLLGNGLVIYVIARSKKMRKQLTILFVMNQSCIDFAGSFFLIVCHLPYHLESESTISNLVCILVGSEWPMYSALLTSTFNLVIITIERFSMICYPILHRNWNTRKRALVIVIILWISGAICGIPTAATTRLVHNECIKFKFWPHPAIEAATWFIVAAFISIGTPFFFIISYTKIFIVIRQRIKMKKCGTLHLHDPNKKWVLDKKEKNILKTMAIVCTCFIVCYLPDVIKLILGGLGLIDMADNNTMYGIPQVFMFINLCINPFIYIFQFEVFQQEFIQYVCFGRWNRVSTLDSTTTPKTETEI